MEELLKSALTLEGFSFEFISSKKGLKKVIIDIGKSTRSHIRPDPFLEENFLNAFYGRPYIVPRLDLEGLTSFRQKVLDAIMDIPFGKTATYQDIAIKIGRPKAARAVGQALGWNPIPIFFP